VPFGVAFTQFDTNSGLERVEQAHNEYLQVASDAGLVGIAIGGFFSFSTDQDGPKELKGVKHISKRRRRRCFRGCVRRSRS
jgi:hypothetical protein